MKLKLKQFVVFKDDIYILPTIVLNINSFQYDVPNFAICFHFLIFHARLLWMKGE